MIKPAVDPVSLDEATDRINPCSHNVGSQTPDEDRLVMAPSTSLISAVRRLTALFGQN